MMVNLAGTWNNLGGKKVAETNNYSRNGFSRSVKNGREAYWKQGLMKANPPRGWKDWSSNQY